MTPWKSSTLLVLVAFTLSVVLLFAKAGMVRERNLVEDNVVSNHIYSPAAADPDLRVPERAERLMRATPKPKPSAEAKPVSISETVSSPAVSPERSPKEAKPAETKTTKTTPAQGANMFYVVTATFSSKENADKGVVQMKKKGLKDAFVGTFDEGKFYSVIGNTFADEASARFMVTELLREHKIKAYIYYKKD